MEVLVPSVYAERLQVTATAFSSRLVQQPPRHQRWRCGLGSPLGLLPGLETGIGGGGNNAAG